MNHAKALRGVESLAVLCAIWVPGCGGSTSLTDSGAAAPISIAEFPSQFAAAFCDNIAGCCQGAAIAFDPAICKVNISGFVNRSLTGPNIKYDPNVAGGCLAAFGSYVRGCRVDNSADANTACNGVFAGTLPEGAPCTVSDECAAPPGGSATCQASTAVSPSTAGTCTAALHAQLGQACFDTCPAGSRCTVSSGPGTSTADGFCYVDDGLYCGPAGTCQPLVALGEACVGLDACGKSAFCSVGVCAARKADGASCTEDSECAGSLCEFSSSAVAGSCAATSIASADTCAGTLG